MLITNRLDPAWPHSERVREMISERRTLDRVFRSIRVPVLLTYDSAAVAKHSSEDEHLPPRPLQDVSAEDLVMERVKPSSGIGLGRPVKRSLQLSNLVLLGGPSHLLALTSPSLRVTHERSSGPSLTDGCVVRSARSVLRPPPTPTRPASTSRLKTGYRTQCSGGPPQTAGPGRASPVPVATFSTFHAPYAGRSFGAALPGSTPLPWPSP